MFEIILNKFFTSDPSKFIEESNRRGELVSKLFLKYFLIAWCAFEASLAIISYVVCSMKYDQVNSDQLFYTYKFLYVRPDWASYFFKKTFGKCSRKALWSHFILFFQMAMESTDNICLDV